MPSLIEISPRIAAAAALFEDNESLTGVYLCADGQGFTKEGVASAHAKDLNGDRRDYDFIEPADVEVLGDIASCDSEGAVDTVLAAIDDPKGILLQAGDTMKARLAEQARVEAVTTYVATCEDVAVLRFLLHNEENEDLISVINTKIDEL